MSEEPQVRKRLRTTRACMPCRRRKVKCNGTQPCFQCQAAQHVCIFDPQDQRSSTAEYIRCLERRIGELEQGANSQVANGQQTNRGQGERNTTNVASNHTRSSPLASEMGESVVSDEDVIETMIGTREGAVADARSQRPSHSSFAGLSVLVRVQSLCRRFFGLAQNSPIETLEDDFIHAFNCTPPSLRSSLFGQRMPLLPPAHSIDRAIDVIVNQACCNMAFLDQETLYSITEILHAQEDVDLLSQNDKSLALIYAVLALARRFERAKLKQSASTSLASAPGLQFFCACRALIDPADCCDLLSLQALLCLILYSQMSSMIPTCYSYICIAVSACFQMGFYTDVAPYGMSEREKASRRQIFTSLNIMDTYVTIALGIPKTLRDLVSEQTLPTSVRPLNITDPVAGTYAHAQLIQILASAVESIHPVNRPISQKNGFYGVEHNKIVAIETQLEAWFAELSPFPSTADMESDANAFRSQLLLRLSYAHVQMVLYKPFVHHTLRDIQRPTTMSLKAYACGSGCIKAAMQAVWLTEKLEACNLFNEAQWWTTLIIAFTASCLALFVVTNKTDPTINETRDAICRIKALCSRYADRNSAMARCSKFLESITSKQEDVFPDGGIGLQANFAQQHATMNANTKDSEEYSGGEMLQAVHLPYHADSVESFFESPAGTGWYA